MRASYCIALAALFAAAFYVAPPTSAAAPALAAPVAPLSPKRESVIEFLRCMAREGATMTSGHRGGVAPGYPENAVETFAHTLSVAPMLIEGDTRLTKDGAIILMHDDTLERTTTGKGAVSDHTLAELKSLYLVDNDKKITAFRVPTLADALVGMRGRGILAIDVKEDASIPLIAKAIQDADARGYALVNLYRPAQAMILHRIDPKITTMLPIESREDLEVLRLSGVNLKEIAAWVGIDYYDVRNQALWNELESAGIPQAFATLFRRDDEMKKSGDLRLFGELADMGVDVIPTDLHMQAYQTLSARRNTIAAVKRCGA